MHDVSQSEPPVSSVTHNILDQAKRMQDLRQVKYHITEMAFPYTAELS